MFSNQNENINNNKCNNNDCKKGEEYFNTFVINSTNILEREENKNLNANLGKFFGIPIEEEDSINQSTNSSLTLNTGNSNKETNGHKLMSIFTEKIFPKCNLDGFIISKKMSEQYFKKNDENKIKLEQCVNYILKNITKMKYSRIINLDLELIQNLGYILMSSYYKFGEFKISDRKELKSNIKKARLQKINASQDFYNHCMKNKLNIEGHKKTSYWDKNASNYCLPGIFIFLMNSLENIESLKIKVDIYNQNLTKDDLDFLAIVIYNFQYLFCSTNHIKINLIHRKLQCGIYSKYYEDYIKALNGKISEVKKKYLKLDYIYDKKWDFRTDFLLEQYNQLHKEKLYKEKKDNNSNNTSIDMPQINELNNKNSKPGEKKSSKNFFKNRFSGLFKKKSNSKRLTAPNAQYIKKLNNSSFISTDIDQYDYESEQFSNNNPDMVYNKIEPLSDKSNILKSIIFFVNSINRCNNLCKLELILNDSYFPEFHDFFENEIFDEENRAENIPLLKNFHIIDIFSNKFTKLNTINLEINSLDFITFKKILEIIYTNPASILSLYISFFSSDVTYHQQSLYRLYKQMELSEKKFKADVEKQILDSLLNNFCNNLQALFNLIRYRKIHQLGFNLDIPEVIMNRKNYMIVIIKFILNLLLYITKSESIVQEIILLAPKIQFNYDLYPFIDKALELITPGSNKIITEISFQVQLYKIINIKNIINESLIILNIGDCDLITFKSLVDNLVPFQFCIKSLLSKLSISLVKSIRKFNKELYNLLYKIFNIKIKQLRELNIYSNIIINNIKEYLTLLNVFKSNWISSVKLTLNKKSKEIIASEQCETEKNKIKYYVPDCLENDLLSAEEKIFRKKMNNDKLVFKNDEVFWYLKYMIQIRCSHCYIDNDKKKRTESLSKFLTNNILSYIHFQKYLIIKHDLELIQEKKTK